MNSVVPVDVSRLGQILVTRIEAATDNDGAQRRNTKEVPLWKIECLIRPPRREDGTTPRASVETVSIPSMTAPKLPEMSAISFDELIARSWEINGRSGISFSAQAVRRQGDGQA